MKSELKERQLNELYGPLYMLAESGRFLFRKLFSEGGIPIPTVSNPYTDWRYWIEDVFIPFNEKTEKIIFEKGFLIDDEKMIDVFNQFLLNSMECKILSAKWKNGVFAENHANDKYPKEFYEKVKEKYFELKEKLYGVKA